MDAHSTSRTAANALYHLTFDDFCDWYAEAIKPRLYDARSRGRRDRARRARAAARAPASGHAARDRGDLVAPPGRARAADRLALAGARTTRSAPTRAALDRVQEAAVTFRRSGVRVALGVGGRASASSTPSSGRSARRRRATRQRSSRACEGDRPRGGDARERALRRQRARRRSSRRSGRSSSASGASSRRSRARGAEGRTWREGVSRCSPTSTGTPWRSRPFSPSSSGSGRTRSSTAATSTWGPLPEATAELLARARRAVRPRQRGSRRDGVRREARVRSAEPTARERWMRGAPRRAAPRRCSRRFPATVELEVEGLGDVLFCHGSPRSDEELITARDAARPGSRTRSRGVTADASSRRTRTSATSRTRSGARS